MVSKDKALVVALIIGLLLSIIAASLINTYFSPYHSCVRAHLSLSAIQNQEQPSEESDSVENEREDPFAYLGPVVQLSKEEIDAEAKVRAVNICAKISKN